jgi:hypothetical protein
MRKNFDFSSTVTFYFIQLFVTVAVAIVTDPAWRSCFDNSREAQTCSCLTTVRPKINYCQGCAAVFQEFNTTSGLYNDNGFCSAESNNSCTCKFWARLHITIFGLCLVLFIVQVFLYVAYESFDVMKSQFDAILNRLNDRKQALSIEYLVVPIYSFFAGFEPIIMMIAWFKVIYRPLDCRCDIDELKYSKFPLTAALIATPIQVMCLTMLKLNIFSALENLKSKKYIKAFVSLIRPDIFVSHMLFFVLQFIVWWISIFSCLPFCMCNQKYLKNPSAVMKTSNPRIVRALSSFNSPFVNADGTPKAIMPMPATIKVPKKAIKARVQPVAQAQSLRPPEEAPRRKSSSGEQSKSPEKPKTKASSVHPTSQQATNSINQMPSSGSIKSQTSSKDSDIAAERSRLKRNPNRELHSSDDEIMEIV